MSDVEIKWEIPEELSERISRSSLSHSRVQEILNTKNVELIKRGGKLPPLAKYAFFNIEILGDTGSNKIESITVGGIQI